MTNIKLCFVKQPWSPMWSWQSTQFTTPQAILDTFHYKAGLLSFLLACRGNVWVMEDGPPSPAQRMWKEADPDATRELYERTPVTRWGDVPWGDYDIALSSDPIVPAEIIRAHPNVLWCYRLAEHTAGTYEKVLGGYDLACDHTMASPKTIKRLPQTVSMPFMVNARIMRDLIRPTNKPAVFLPARSVCSHGSLQVEKPPETLARLPVKHPSIWDLRRTYQAILDGLIEPATQHLQNLGSCRYLLNVRPGGEVGQPIIEAAALSLIVISSPEIYATVVHPRCRVSNAAEGVCVIRQLESASDVRQEILEYQDRVLRRQFWDEPLARFKRALKIKRQAIA